MRRNRWTTSWVGVVLYVAIGQLAVAKEGPAAAVLSLKVVPGESMPRADEIAAEGVALAPALKVPDRCAPAEVVSVPTRPNWDSGVGTAQCGVIEIDYGWLDQPMGRGMRQRMLVSSLRYGLTPKLEVRWGLTSLIQQGGGGSPSLKGAGDHWLNLQYRFQEQSRWIPALALNYGVKLPQANPAKGFGSGFIDHQLVLIASRDLGKNHLDFNLAGSLVGLAHRHDGAAQFGLALTRAVTPKLAWILESYGGPQPGIADRYGAGLSGISYALRPWLVLDGAYVRTYTAGTPRAQTLFGFTYAMRPGLPPLPRRAAMARFLGR